VSNMLGGRVPGIIAVTRSGEPGNNFSEFWIRGMSTFGASSSALVLIDGIEGNINDLDPADIESFSILKDASATAVYGTRGANGVVVVTTKRGKAGKLHVNFKTNATYSYSPRMPEYADAYQYATLANEARSVRGDDPVYSATELELFKTGLDPDLYPNVNWRDVILKDHVINNQHHLSISGGGQSARYYMSLGILNSEALFKQDKSASKHDVNVNYHKYNFRTNIDADLTKTTLLSLNLEAVIKTQNAPGTGSSNKYLWESQANLPPTVVPVRYSNGQLPAYGTNLEDKSPYVRLNYMGYTTNETYSTKINVGLSQDLGMITEGLSVRGLFSFSMNGAHIVDRHMNPEQYYADPKDGRYLDGSLKTVRTVNKEDMTATQGSASNRELYFEAAANYKRLFNQDHRVTGLAHFYRQELTNVDWGNGVLVSIPKRYQALSFRATYSYKDTYLVEGNLGYTGSENFNKERRYGWFPSISGGWVPTQYDWYRNLLPFNNFLKFRASWGRVGNDRLKDENGNDIRFPYLTTLGNVSSTWGTGLAENRTGSMNLKWEVSTKTNFGIDARFFDDKVDMTVDFFHTKTTDIFQRRANIPDEGGLSNVLPYANIGSMKSWGMDGTLAYTHTFNKDMALTVRGNFTHAENEVIYWEQSGVNYPYQSNSGVPYKVQRGLIALGLFKDEDDIKSSPKQTFMDNYRPGDIKYKDVNGDGKIDKDDVVPLNYSAVPFIQYGFALDWNYKAFRVSILFEGVSKVQYFQGGRGFYPFLNESRGNLLEMVADPRKYAEANGIDPALAENPNAKFPRLTYGENKNNNQESTFWLADGKYLRLKNVDISYRFTNNWLKSRVGVESATLSLIGENLHVWDKVKLFDPSQASGNGAEYPLQRIYTLQLNLTF
jgi:TonB-linked SusC/RagA family outer membrane protein